MKARQGLLAAALWLACAPAIAQAAPVVLRGAPDYAPLGFYLQVLEDPTGRLTLPDVVSGAAAQDFRPSRRAAPNYGITRSAYWARLTLRNESGAPLSTLLVYGLPLMEKLDVYYTVDSDRFTHEKGGLQTPLSRRAFPHRTQVFPLVLEPHRPLTVYLRFETTAEMCLDLALWDERALARKDMKLQLAMGADLGLLVVLALYNLLLFAAFHDRSYIHYVAFLFSYGMYQASLSGIGAYYLWPESPRWAVYAPLFFCGIAAYTGLLFTRSFLGPAGRTRASETAFRSLMVVALLASLWAFVDTRSANYVTALAVFGAFGLVIVGGVRSWWTGYRPARYLLAAWALFIAGGVAFGLAVFGVVEANLLTLNGVHLGFGAGTILLSFALGDRITSMQEKFRREMSETVTARTEDLHRTVESLETEISRHEQTVRALRESERKYRRLVESVNDVIYQTDADGLFTYVNPVAVRLVSDTADRLLGRHYLELVRSDHRRSVGRFYQRQIDERRPDSYSEFPIVDAQGRELWIGQSVHLVEENGRIVGFRAIARDITERKRVEAELEHERRLFEVFMDNIPDHIYFKDRESRFFKVNRAQAAWLGLSDPAAAIGKTDADFFSDEHAAKARADELQVMTTGLPMPPGEERETWPDGRETWVFSAKFPLRDAAGAIVGTFGVSRDVTERRRAEERLRESERRLADIIEFLPDPTLVIDDAGRVIAWNHAIEELTGVKAADMLGKGDFEYALPFYGERRPILIDLVLQPDQHYEQRYADILRHGGAIAGEAYMPHLRGGGKVYLFGTAAALRDSRGRVTGAIESIRDITERKHAEEALRQSEQRYRLLADNLNDVIWTMDLGLRFTYLSPSVERLRGYTVEEAMAQSPEELLTPASLSLVMTVFAEELAREQGPNPDRFRSRTLDLEQYRRDGSTVLTEVNMTFLRDDQGRPIGVLGVSRDITERKRMEAEIIAAKEGAETANRAKSEFLANMSHELRTPLNSIIGFSEMMQLQHLGRLSDKQLQYVQRIYASGQHLLQLINDILDLSKVEAGKMELEPGPVAIARLLEDSLTMVREKALLHGVALELNVEPELRDVELEADERKLKQVLFNLLSNAVKFTPDGGMVLIEARRDGEELRVSVADSGIGLEPQDLDRIFQAFVQLDGSYTRSQPGTGLGLALTRRLVELHGGRIWAESEGPGRGSTFAFTLPWTEAAGETATIEEIDLPPVAPRREPRAAKPLALVVEDDPNASDLLREYLLEGGYLVAQAFDGEQALRMVRQLHPDAVTLDIMLPRRDGLQILAELKTTPELHAIPVVIVSVTEKQQLALTLGAADWLIKPVDKQQLIDVLGAARASAAEGAGTVLLIDDDPPTLEALAAAARSAGWRAMTAAGGAAGVELAAANQPDVIILDLVMPDMNGFEVVAALQGRPETRDIPIVIHTAKELTREESQRLYNQVRSVTPKGDKRRLLDELERLSRRRPT